MVTRPVAGVDAGARPITAKRRPAPAKAARRLDDHAAAAGVEHAVGERPAALGARHG